MGNILRYTPSADILVVARCILPSPVIIFKEHVETPNLLTSWNAGFYAASTLLAKLHVDHVVVRVPHPIRLCALGLLFYRSDQKWG